MGLPFVVTLAVVVALALAGCVAAPTQTHRAAPKPVPTPTATAERIVAIPQTSIDDLILGDPSFYHRALLTVGTDGADPHGCVLTVVAIAPLKWTVPDTRPDLQPRDSGTRDGATGKVTMTEGKPVSYAVAPGDTLTSIGQRFGITVNDIFFLNPLRKKAQDPMAYAYEKLNLDKAAR
jgi:LysM repeat protein